jgi:outer membrane protein OmpA-like peptidoglycan-associated protein
MSLITRPLLSRVFLRCIAPLAVLFLIQSQRAGALGFNAETFSPSAGSGSGLLFETPATLPARAWMYGATVDYVLRPVELGDGKDTRFGIVDHLLMSHLSVGYGLVRDLELYGVLPVSLLNVHSNPDNYLLDVGASRKFFLLSDPRVGIKFRAFEWGTGIAGTHSLVADFRAPLGDRKAMLSDGTNRIDIGLPSSLFSTTGNWEIGLTPGIVIWGDRERVISKDRILGTRRELLSRSFAWTWDTRFQWSALGRPNADRHLALEAGLKVQLSQGYVSVSSAGNPWEWAFGGRYRKSDDLTFHASIGSSVGRGVGSPLARLMAGVRYMTDAPKKHNDDDDYDPRDALPSYSDVDLDRILADSRAEEAPRQLSSDESLVRLLVGDEVIDIGYVRFKFNSAELSREAMKTIMALKERLDIEKPESVHIEGHTDSVGSLDYNMALSKRRADSVRKALVERDIPGDKITTSGVAFKYPIASNATKQGRAANRRIEVSLNGKRFRNSNLTPQEMAKFREWIAPGGKRPTRD